MTIVVFLIDIKYKINIYTYKTKILVCKFYIVDKFQFFVTRITYK